MKRQNQKLPRSKNLRHKTFSFLKNHILIASVATLLFVALCTAAAVHINNKDVAKRGLTPTSQNALTNGQNDNSEKSGTSMPSVASTNSHKSDSKKGTVNSTNASNPPALANPAKSPSPTKTQPSGSIRCDSTQLANATYTDNNVHVTYTTKFKLITHGNISGASLTYEIKPVQNGAPGGLYDRYTAKFNGQTNIVLTNKIADIVLNQPSDSERYLQFEIDVTSNTPSVTGLCAMQNSGYNPYATPPYTNYWP